MRRGTNENSINRVIIGGPMRWGTSEMGDQWDWPKMGGLMKGGPMRRGTNEFK